MSEHSRSVFVKAPDGLRLHVREYGAANASALAVVCLPGLTRTVADFDVLAPALAYGSPPPPGEGSGAGLVKPANVDPLTQPHDSAPSPPPREGQQQQTQNKQRAARRVIALDARGRGLSEYDHNPENYNLLVELGDLVAVLAALAVGRAVFIGSSRGGLLTMHLAVAHATAIAGVVFHDIGPVIEPKGLARLKSYVGKLPQPRSFAQGADILRQLLHEQFPKLTAEQWLAFAQRSWRKRELSTQGCGALVPTHDIRLSRTLEAVDIEQPLPPLWNAFDALARVPILVIRGARSDLLSAETVAAMAARHPGLESIEVPDQGHVPLLEGDLAARIVEFVGRCESSGSPLAQSRSIIGRP
jgi:pimeloyl-ACP methyl ester carboxylesterase